MKLSTKIILALFLVCLVPAIYFGIILVKEFKAVEGGFIFNYDVYGILGLVFILLSITFGTILYFKFLKNLALSKLLFFSSLPLTIAYGLTIYYLVNLNTLNSQMAKNLKILLNMSAENRYNTALWAILISIIYCIVLYSLFAYICKPLSRAEKVMTRLSDGRVREEDISLGGGKSFLSLENSMNKINYRYRENENILRKTRLETQKFIPKQFFKFLGKNDVTELELGNQVRKRATLLYCALKGDEEMRKSLSLEDNFNFLNSYLKVASPLIRRYGGFVDKYVGEGLIAVFSRPERALDCAHAIKKAISLENRTRQCDGCISARVSLHTGEVMVGIVGEEERKSPSIISDNINLITKLDKISDFMETHIVFTKALLDDLPARYSLRYRYVGSLKTERTELSIFESLEVYKRDKREKLTSLKGTFEHGVILYNNAEYDQSALKFEEVLKAVPNDKPSYIYYNKSIEKSSGKTN